MARAIPASLRYDPLGYLLDPRRAVWVRHQTLVRILGRPPDDPEVLVWREERDRSASVSRLEAKQLGDGSFPCMPWRHVHEFYLNRLILMGYGLDDPIVDKGVNSVLGDQLPGGGYNPDLRNAAGRESPARKEEGHWSPCMTGFVTKMLIDLGLEADGRVQALLGLLRASQRESGGWICQGQAHRAGYCILGGTPWSFVALVSGGVLRQGDASAECALRIFERHKRKIVRHGYHRDLCYRCDEALLLPSLSAVGLTRKDALLGDLYDSLVNKQQPDGSWMFRGRQSVWYTIEAVAALGFVDHAGVNL